MSGHRRATPRSSLPALPYLLPEVPVLWREPGVLQVGIDPVWARQIPHAGAREFRAVRRLDGTRSLARILSDFVGENGDPDWLTAVLSTLVSIGAVIDRATSWWSELPAPERLRLAPTTAAASLARPGANSLARRRAAFVHVCGTGRVGVGVAALLSAAGIGSVRVSPTAGDAQRVTPRSLSPLGPGLASLGAFARDAAREAVSRNRWTAAASAPARRREPDLVVLCPARVVPPATAERLTLAETPHLTALTDGPSARVGPLVLPGRTACLRCLDLHRADRDPQWPLILTQVAHHRGAQLTADDVVLSTLTAATAVTHALAVIDDPHGPWPSSAGAFLEFRLPELRWSRRAWSPHPDCGSHWAPDPHPRAA